MNFHPAGATARRLTYSKTEVCEALGCSEATFDKKRAELEKGFGFPPRVPGFNAWPIAAIEDWIAHSGGLYTPFAERQAPVAAHDGNASVELDSLYGRPAAPIAQVA